MPKAEISKPGVNHCATLADPPGAALIKQLFAPDPKEKLHCGIEEVSIWPWSKMFTVATAWLVATWTGGSKSSGKSVDFISTGSAPRLDVTEHCAATPPPLEVNVSGIDP